MQEILQTISCSYKQTASKGDIEHLSTILLNHDKKSDAGK